MSFRDPYHPKHHFLSLYLYPSPPRSLDNPAACMASPHYVVTMTTHRYRILTRAAKIKQNVCFFTVCQQAACIHVTECTHGGLTRSNSFTPGPGLIDPGLVLQLLITPTPGGVGGYPLPNGRVERNAKI